MFFPANGLKVHTPTWNTQSNYRDKNYLFFSLFLGPLHQSEYIFGINTQDSENYNI